MSDETLVIGAGIIGISSALALQAQGFKVRVIDRKGVAAEASQRNAGAFAFSDVEPLATPGIMRKAPKWLFDPTGPLSLPPLYAMNIAPWMLRFWRASWPDRYEASVAAQSSLMKLSQNALERQIKATDGESLIRREGQLQLYEGERQFRASLPGWELRRRHGISFDMLDGADAIAEIQPGLNRRFTHAAFTPDWMNTVDPAIWTKHLAKVFQAQGGIIEISEIISLEQGESELLARTPANAYPARQIIVAAGAWSHHLARGMGDKLPLETERGYNTTLPAGAFDLRTHLTFGNHGFVVTKIGEGVRVGGAVELGGLKLKPNYKRAEILLQKAANFMPGLKTDGGEQWMGFRPSMPDSLPVIGRSPQNRNVIYAFGHGHLGLTQAAGTAELVASLASKTESEIPLHPYSPTRF